MDLSVIIPTHNRAESLRRALTSLLGTKTRAAFEIVIVDNNSSDHTPAVAESFGDTVRRVFEPRTALSAARDRGAATALGEILVYCDDDVVFAEGALDSIVRRFRDSPECGVVAGRILPQFETPPPAWASEGQKQFNGWSLYNESVDGRLGKDSVEVEWAAGPLMAVRRSVYQRIGGFPPDTLGVETNRSARLFNKLYVGPGDWGLCKLAREAGWKVLYEPGAVVRHVIPATRMTIGFWRSRLIGEAYHRLSCDWVFEPLSFVAYGRRLVSHARRLRSHLSGLRRTLALRSEIGMCPDEMWAWYLHSYLTMATVFGEQPELPHLLWRIGKVGVPDEEYDDVIRQLPRSYLNLTASAYVYNDEQVAGTLDWARLSGRSVKEPGAAYWISALAGSLRQVLAGGRPRPGRSASKHS